VAAADAEVPCCGAVITAAAPPGAYAGTVSYGPVLNAAAVLLAVFGNVPLERSAHLIGMLLGVPVSAGFADKASARLSGQLEAAGFHDAMHGCWLRGHAGQVWLFTTEFAVEWTSNSERAAKGPKRHQAVSGYWHTQATLARSCRIRSYLDSAANHGLTALEAIRAALAGNPWLPAVPAEA
jgi:hypothetical protein